MVEIILQFLILIILILYAWASYMLTNELLKLSSLNAKQARLVEFREVFRNRIDEFKKMESINFHTIYLADDNQENELIELFLVDLKNKD